MIDEIQARNIALIRQVTLRPSSGLTVLTGETGAGKTALLSACKLLCGERAESSSVREGTDMLVVEGRFFMKGEEEGHIVVRKVGTDGRSRITIDGDMASVGELQTVVGSSVDLCGQHEHQTLMKPANQMSLLDAWDEATIGPAKETYGEALVRAEHAAEEVKRIKEAGLISAAKLEEARFIVRQVEAVDPQEDEYAELIETASRAEHAETLRTVSDAAHDALSGDDGAIDAIQRAAASLDSLTGIDGRLGGYASLLREATFALEDVSRDVRRYRDTIEYDPDTASSYQDRLSALQGLMRTWGPQMEDVLERYREAQETISLVDDSTDRERAAQTALDEAEEHLAACADTLDAVRGEIAPQFLSAVNDRMSRLDMHTAELVYQSERLARDAWTKRGPSRVEYLFRPSEGMSPRPLARIASGGEISRVMLAIKVVLGEADDVETLIFDEVDAGVGGKAAVALADVLADLAKTHQVIVVTHLAQAAVMADTHYKVVRTEESPDGLPETELVALADDDRVHEIARMLSGEVTQASEEHAREMLTSAQKR